MRPKMSAYEDPVQNYTRLSETNVYLTRLAATGWTPTPPARWFKEHIAHIKVYLNVLENTEERDQRPAELMREMISQYVCDKRFSLEYYLLVCDKLIEIVGDMTLENDLEGLGV
jgi:hypothetical protein